jgi:hypothetical protein
MSKYKPLTEALAGRTDDRWTVRFEELEKHLGFALPKAARERAAWWANEEVEPKPHARAWLDKGYRTEALDLKGEEVTFVRHREVGGAEPTEASKAPDPTAHDVMAAAEAVYVRDKATETAKKVGIVAAVLGVLGGAGLVAARILGRRRA